MGCPPTVLTCVVVPPPPETSWWLTMLQIFVPVATALLVAVLAYHYSLDADLRAKITEARWDVQRRALADGQQAIVDHWNCAYKLLQTGDPSNSDITSKLEQTNIQVMVTHSRLRDRDLAGKIKTWQEDVAALLSIQRTPARTRMPSDDLYACSQEFVALCNEIGSSLREVSSIAEKRHWLRRRRVARRPDATPGRSIRSKDGIAD
jgi:hypothetical protein